MWSRRDSDAEVVEDEDVTRWVGNPPFATQCVSGQIARDAGATLRLKVLTQFADGTYRVGCELKVPELRISRAARRNAPKAARQSPLPTLMRLTPIVDNSTRLS
jgi:hypothetical protein